MKIAIALLSLLVVAQLSQAAPVPDWYIAATAQAKANWHEEQNSQHSWGKDMPGLIVSGGCQTVALAGFAFIKFIEKAIKSPSGYPADFWRKLWGKAIHSIGISSTGYLQLDEVLLGLSAGRHPVTYRFSLANPYVPWMPFAAYRPGVQIMIHRDGLPDLELFVMPPDALNGFRVAPNPFGLKYTHWLDKPSMAIQIAAALTFGRVVHDPYTQYLTNNLEGPLYLEDGVSRENSMQLILTPESGWIPRYQGTGRFNPFHPTQSFDFRKRFQRLSVRNGGESLFNVYLRDPLGGEHSIGMFYQTGKWNASPHSDMYMHQHNGFILRRN